MRRIFAIFFFLMGIFFSFSQKFSGVGVPEIENFSPLSYGDKGKIWKISSSNLGIVYMAADYGVLEYDGTTWKTYEGSKGFTRSLCIVDDHLMYTGSDMDFGVWRRNAKNQLVYQSLYPYRNSGRNGNEEFWNTFKIHSKILFISQKRVYVYHQNKLTSITLPKGFSTAFTSEGTVYFSNPQKGLLRFDGSKFIKVFAYDSQNPLEVIGMLKHNATNVLVTKNSGLVKLVNGKWIKVLDTVSEILANAKIFSFAQLPSGQVAFGTILGGMYIVDKQGNLINRISKENGLLNNTVLSLYFEPSGLLWSGMDYGLAKINLKSKITYIKDLDGQFGTGYSAAIQKSKFFLGTNQGLYTIPWTHFSNARKNANFQLISGTQGQVWTLKMVQNQLLMGHDKGLYKVSDQNVEKIDGSEGIWTIKPFSSTYLLTGNYDGISVYTKQGENWKFLKKIPKIVGSCIDIELLNSSMWVNIPNYGVVKATLDKNFEVVKRDIFETKIFEGKHLQMSVYKNQIFISTDLRTYKFSSSENKFVETSEKIASSTVKEALPDFRKPVNIGQGFEFYPVYNGFALKDTRTRQEQFAEYPIVLRGLEAFNNDAKLEVLPSEKIPYRLNNIKLNYAIPQAEDAVYQYRLDGKEWSSWSPKNSFEFLNVAEGNHKVEVRGISSDRLSNTLTVEFKIKAPWYRSTLAYLLYLLTALGTYFGVKKRQQFLLRKQEKELKQKKEEMLRAQNEKHEQEKLKMEQESFVRERELLLQRVKEKTIELAQKAKDDEDKHRILQLVTEKVQEIEDNPSASKLKVKEIRRMLTNYVDKEDNTFEIQMDELHQEFFKAMKKDFPNLSIYDLRLCAYLKIGLNSKEMAEILDVLPSSINVSRSRLRKKLNLKPEEDLFAFLNTY